MEVDAAGGFEDAVKFDEPVGHHDEVAFHTATVYEASRFDDCVDAGVGVGESSHSCDVQVGEGPGVLEGGAGGLTADGRGVVTVGVEGRIKVDQVDAFGVDAGEDFHVVGGPDGAVGEVHGGCFYFGIGFMGSLIL